jgi:hypothetical protein
MVVSGRAATIAAILYMLMPTIDLYNRRAIGEMWAFVSMPMTLYCSTRLFRHRSSKVCDGGASHELRRPALHASLYRIIFTPVLLAVTICSTTEAGWPRFGTWVSRSFSGLASRRCM